MQLAFSGFSYELQIYRYQIRIGSSFTNKQTPRLNKLEVTTIVYSKALLEFVGKTDKGLSLAGGN